MTLQSNLLSNPLDFGLEDEDFYLSHLDVDEGKIISNIDLTIFIWTSLPGLAWVYWCGWVDINIICLMGTLNHMLESIFEHFMIDFMLTLLMPNVLFTSVLFFFNLICNG